MSLITCKFFYTQYPILPRTKYVLCFGSFCIISRLLFGSSIAPNDYLERIFIKNNDGKSTKLVNMLFKDFE